MTGRRERNFARGERAALGATLREVGPDAPTLCGGWSTRDLAAHLVLRATRPVAAAGILVPALAAHTRSVQESISETPWATLVTQVQYPPFWTPLSWGPVDETVNLAEYFVHHEDVLRADPDWSEPRALEPGYGEALWAMVTRRGRVLFRRSPVGVTLEHPDGRTAVVRRAGEADHESVTLAGEPGELVLCAYGRGAEAVVAVRGAPQPVAAFRAARFRV